MTRSLLVAALFWTAPAWGGPPLTTIQDVLYKADGTRFNGTVTITWKSFEASDASAIATHSITEKVVDGNLRVQLVPTTNSTPAVFYQVTYNSDGRIQFTEVWSVSPSTNPLRLRDVRTSASAVAADDGNNTVLESDVIGLIADLGARPQKGPGFAAGHIAMVNPMGLLDSVAGTASDCVHVDGSSGPCNQAPSFVDADTLSGIIDGANTVFTVTNVPNPAGSLSVYRNGLLQKLTQDYTVGGKIIQFAAAATPQPGDTLSASYRIAGTTIASGPQYPEAQVVCGGTGSSTLSTTLASMGTCNIPAGVLLPGDRLEIHYDVVHQGTISGFSVEVHWGNTVVAHRDAVSGDAAIAGRADAAVLANSSQLTFQSWGTVLPFATGLVSASDAFATGIAIDFQGKLAQAGDTLTLANFTVVRLP